MSSKLLIAVIAAIPLFVVFYLVLSRLFADKGVKYARRSLENISREGEVSADLGVEMFKDEADKREDTIRSIPFIGGLHQKLKQTGGNTNIVTYLIMVFVVGFIVAAVVWWFVKNPSFYITAGIVGAWLFHKSFLTKRLERRNEHFMNNFPDAIDMMVRSVKSGHPLLTSMKLIAKSSEPPISTEFQRVVDEVSYGRPLPEALKKMSERIGIMDMNFFVVILSVQQETGGSLAEVLSNLSGIIRKRKQLYLKVKALTSEGRITGKIFVGIPLFVVAAVKWLSPEYMDPLFNTSTGNMVLGAAVGLIVTALVVIKKLCNVDV